MYAAMEDNYMLAGANNRRELSDKLLAALLIGQRRGVEQTGA